MRLRRLEKKDVMGMLEWMHDDTVNCYFRFDAASMKEADAEKFIVFSQNEVNSYHFAVVDDQNCYLGTVSLKSIDEDALTAEYAIVLRKSAQNIGAGRYATSKILTFAFDVLSLNRVYLNVLADNDHAVCFYKKFGFVFEGEFRKHLMLKGDLKSVKWFSLLKEEYTTSGGGGGKTAFLSFVFYFGSNARIL